MVVSLGRRFFLHMIVHVGQACIRTDLIACFTACHTFYTTDNAVVKLKIIKFQVIAVVIVIPVANECFFFSVYVTATSQLELNQQDHSGQ